MYVIKEGDFLLKSKCTSCGFLIEQNSMYCIIICML